MTGDLLVTLQKIKAPMEHRHADKLNNSFPARTLAISYLSGVAFIAEIVYLVMNGLSITGDIVMLVCTAAVVWSGLMLFRMREKFKTEVRAVKKKK